MNIKNICIVTRCMKSGGAERVISILMQYLEKMKIAVTLILIDNTEIFYDIPKSVNIYTIGRECSNPLTDKFKRYIQVRKLIKELNPDIVLSIPEDIATYTILSLIGTEIPVIASERNNPKVEPKKKITRILRIIAYQFCNGFIFQTQQAAECFSKKIQDKGIVLPNPMLLENVPVSKISERKKIVVGVGRLEKQKNFKLLIDAFSEFYKTHSDYKLCIYGDGRLKNELVEYASSLLPENIFDFPGNQKYILDKIKNCSIFVLSSDYEGMPNALIEAMAVGLPCISTDCPIGGPAFFIKHEQNGLLVDVGNALQLSNALSLIADNPDIMQKFSNEAFEIREMIDANIVCSQWLDYFNFIVNSRG